MPAEYDPGIAASSERAKELAQNALEAIEGEIMETYPAVTAGDVAACLVTTGITDERRTRTVVKLLEALEAGRYVHSCEYGDVAVWFNPKPREFNRDYYSDPDAPWPPLSDR